MSKEPRSVKSYRAVDSTKSNLSSNSIYSLSNVQMTTLNSAMFNAMLGGLAALNVKECCATDLCYWFIDHYQNFPIEHLPPDYQLKCELLKNTRSFGKYLGMNYQHMGLEPTRRKGNRQYFKQSDKQIVEGCSLTKEEQAHHLRQQNKMENDLIKWRMTY